MDNEQDKLQKSWEEFARMDQPSDKFDSVFKEKKFYPGRMVCGSKSYYHKMRPTHVTVFNSNICTKEHGKIWYGDIDLTEDEKTLIEIAKEIGVPLYLFYEHDARFERATNPDFNQALFKITDKNITIVKEGYNQYFEKKRGKWRNVEAVVKRYKSFK